MLTIQTDFKKLVQTISEDVTQRNLLQQLAVYRLDLEDKELSADDFKLIDETVERYIKNGIHYIPQNTKFHEQGAEEIEYLAEESGTTLEGWGYNEKTERILTFGFIIPIRDSKNRIIFYINYSFERDKSQKYINVYTGNYDGHENGIKVYGMHNTQLAYKQNKMVVMEGVFDCNLISDFNIPTCAMLGTQLTPYQKCYLKRFDNLIFISDNDVEGENAWNRFRKLFPNATRYLVPTKYKDPDAFFASSKKNHIFMDWINTLKSL